MIRLHLVNLSRDADLGLYEAESVAQAWEFAREDRPNMDGERLDFFPEVQVPELMGEVSADAQTAFAAVVRRYVARCRSTMDGEQIDALVRDHFAGCSVKAAVSLAEPTPWLKLHDPAAASSVHFYLTRALGPAEVERVESYARTAALEAAARDAYAGHIGQGATHLYRFAQSS